MNYLPKARAEEILTQDADGELLIYDLSSNKALCLNETAKTVWQACDGNTGFDEFRKTNPDFSDELIWLTLEKLNADNLFAEKERIAPDFKGLSRREVVKKIGFGSMIALPAIASIVAPAAIHAQSSACGGSCLNPGATVNCSYGAIGAIACVNNLTASCCSGMSFPTSTSCSCPLGGPCSGSATCCGSPGNVISGSFGPIGAIACINTLTALCCSGTSNPTGSSCSCPLGGPCSGSVTCA